MTIEYIRYDLAGGKGHPVGADPEPPRPDSQVDLEHQGYLGEWLTRLFIDVQGIKSADCV